MKAAIRALIPLVIFVLALGTTPFSLGSAIGLAVLGFAFALFIPVRPVPRRMISLQSLALVALGAYSLAIPIHQVVVGDYDPETVRFAFDLSLVAAAGIICGYLAEYLMAPVEPVAFTSESERRWAIYARVGWIVFAVGMASAILAVSLTVGFHAYLTAGYAGRVLLKRAAGPVELGLYHAVIGLLLVALARMKSRAPRRRLTPRQMVLVGFLLAICLAFVIYVSFLGIRRPSFFLLLSLVMLRGVAGRGYSRLQLTMLAPALLLFSLFANFRQVLSDQGLAAASLFIRQNFSFAWFDLSKSELGAPYRAIMDVIATWNDEPLRLGATFLASVPYAFPSAFSLPITSLSQEYTLRNFSTAFIAIGGNMGFSPVAEAYLNYRVFGVWAYFLLIGYSVGRLQTRAVQRGFPFDLIVFAIAAPWFIFWLRTDLASFSKTFVYSVLPPLLFALMLLSLLRSSRSRGESSLLRTIRERISVFGSPPDPTLQKQ